MKYRAHETFFIRKGWLSKGLKHIQTDPSVFVSKEKNPIDVLGIGSNMVKSLRHWMKAAGLSEETISNRIKIQETTDLGKIIWKYDKYFEELGTLWLIHYKIVSNKELSPAWYFFFNEFILNEFQKEDFITALQSFASMNNESPAESSIEDDFNCLVNTYIQRRKINPNRVSPESNIECPLDELGLIDLSANSTGKDRIYRKACPSAGSIPPYILYAVIQDQSNNKKEIKIKDLLSKPLNIGKIFNLDIVSLYRELDILAKNKLIDVVRTAGLDVIKIKEEKSFDECIKTYYESLNGGKKCLNY